MRNIIWQQPDGTRAVTMSADGERGFAVMGTTTERREVVTPTEKDVLVNIPTPEIARDRNGKIIMGDNEEPTIEIVDVPTMQKQAVSIITFIDVEVPCVIFEDSPTHAQTLLKQPAFEGFIPVAYDQQLGE